MGDNRKRERAMEMKLLICVGLPQKKEKKEDREVMQWKPGASWRCLCPNTNTHRHTDTHMSTHTHTCFRSRACSHAQTLHAMGRGRKRVGAGGPGRRVCFPGH